MDDIRNMSDNFSNMGGNNAALRKYLIFTIQTVRLFIVRVLSTIGRGSSGVVNKAVWKGCIVAAKTIPVVSVDELQIVQREIKTFRYNMHVECSTALYDNRLMHARTSETYPIQTSSHCWMCCQTPIQ